LQGLFRLRCPVTTESQIVADALDDMKLNLPKPTVDLKEIRRLYHKDAAHENSKK
jgi:hypothetical protein